MPGAQRETTVSCTACGKLSPSGLLFCPFCACKIEDPERETGATRYNCPFCHCADEFSRAFCTVCGAQINQGEAIMKLKALGKRTGFNWSRQAAEPVKIVGGVRKLPAPVSDLSAASRSPLLLYGAAGIATGLLATALLCLLGSSTLNYLLARFICPQHGLVVAVKLEDAKNNEQIAQIRLVNENDKSSWQFTTDRGGMLTASPASGRYGMYVSAPGYETAFTPIEIDDTRPTLIGFPAPLVLPHP